MSRLLALDWQDGRVVLLAARVGKTGATVERGLDWPEEQPPGPGVSDAMGQRLKERLKSAGIAAAPLIIAVPRDRLILKEIRFPPVPPHEEPGLVRFQAMKELADSDEVVIDYQLLRGATEGGQCTALVAAIKKSALQSYRLLAQSAGLKLAGVSPRALGFLAAAQHAPEPPPPEAPFAVLALASGGSEFIVGRGSDLLLDRTVSAGAKAGGAGLLGDIRRNLAVFAAQSPGDAIRALYVAGPPESQPIAADLASALAFPVHVLPASDGAAVPARIALAGLVELFARTRTLPVNFAHPREPKPPRDPNRRIMILAGALAATLLLGMVILGWSRLAAKDRIIRDLSDARSDLDRELVLLDQDDRRFKAVKEWQENEVVWLDELYDLTAATPNIDRLRFTHIVGNPIVTGSGSAKANKYAARVEIKGLVTDDTKPLIALTRELDVDGFHRVEAKTTAPNTGGNRRQFLQQWSTKYDVEKRLDPSDPRAATRYDRKFTATPPPRRRSGMGGFDLGILGGLIP